MNWTSERNLLIFWALVGATVHLGWHAIVDGAVTSRIAALLFCILFVVVTCAHVVNITQGKKP